MTEEESGKRERGRERMIQEEEKELLTKIT